MSLIISLGILELSYQFQLSLAFYDFGTFQKVKQLYNHCQKFSMSILIINIYSFFDQIIQAYQNCLINFKPGMVILDSSYAIFNICCNRSCLSLSGLQSGKIYRPTHNRLDPTIGDDPVISLSSTHNLPPSPLFIFLKRCIYSYVQPLRGPFLTLQANLT